MTKEFKPQAYSSILFVLFGFPTIADSQRDCLTLVIFTVGFLLTYGVTCVVLSLSAALLKSLLFFRGIKRKKNGEIKPIGFPAALLQTLPVGAIWAMLLIFLGIIQVYIPVMMETETSLFHITNKFLVIAILLFVLFAEGSVIRLINRDYKWKDIVIFTLIGGAVGALNYMVLYKLLGGFN